jgi:urease accessory protein
LNICCESQTRLTVTTQAAERLRAQRGEIVSNRLELRSNARLIGCQETILFDTVHLNAHLVAIDAQSTLLLVEPIVFGRAAMGKPWGSVTSKTGSKSSAMVAHYS